METIFGKNFKNQTVVMDERNYVQCTFTNCEIVYTGGDFAWVNSRFDHCKITITGNASKTLAFMHQVGILQPPTQVLTGPQMADAGGVH